MRRSFIITAFSVRSRQGRRQHQYPFLQCVLNICLDFPLHLTWSNVHWSPCCMSSKELIDEVTSTINNFPHEMITFAALDQDSITIYPNDGKIPIDHNRSHNYKTHACFSLWSYMEIIYYKQCGNRTEIGKSYSTFNVWRQECTKALSIYVNPVRIFLSSFLLSEEISCLGLAQECQTNPKASSLSELNHVCK